MTTTPAGWYPDPNDAGQLRYWDGAAWSESVAPAAPADQAEPAAAPDGLPSYGAYASTSYPAQPGAPVPSPYETQNASNTLSIIGIVLGVISLLFIPIIFGPAALVLGFLARRKGERLAKVALIVGAVGLIGGLVIGAVVYSSTMA